MIRILLAMILAAGLAACGSNPLQQDMLAQTAMAGSPDLYVVVTMRNDDPRVSSRAGSTLRGYDNIATYSAGVGARSAVRALSAEYRLREVSGWPIASLGIHCVVFQIPADATAAQVIDLLRKDARVESAQPLQTFATQSDASAITYNDPYEKLQRSLITMDIPAAHRWSRGAGIHVAVIDTGMDTRHPDLAGRIAEKRNFVDGDWNAFDNDRHGTAVGGLIAATANNAVGIVGVAPEATLHAYKACWQLASGANAAVCNTFTLAKALSAAIEARVHVANLSLAGPGDPLLTRLVRQARQRGMIVVGAVPVDRRVATFPTDVEGVISVTSMDRAAVTGVTLAAPGAEVLTLVPDGHYDFASGSSMATANVSGVIALLLARNRDATSAGLMQLLASTTTDSLVVKAQSRSVNAAAALCVVIHDKSCSEGSTAVAAQ